MIIFLKIDFYPPCSPGIAVPGSTGYTAWRHGHLNLSRKPVSLVTAKAHCPGLGREKEGNDLI